MRVIYLHGFASSPQSSKARFFGHKFADKGVPCQVPELDAGDFEHLTITGQLAVIRRAVDETPRAKTVLMGSSLGGYLAALYAEQNPKTIDRLVLMAPAFQFFERWKARYTPEQLEAWKKQGWAPVYHYGSNSERRMSPDLLEDAAKYSAVPDFHQRALILHGTKDPVVPYQLSYDYALEHSRTRLALFDAGHELTEVLEEMWKEVAAFLELA